MIERKQHESKFLRFIKYLSTKGVISPNRIETKTVLKGNPKIGQVDYIRQAHQAEGIEGDLKKSVSYYQLEILKYLQQRKYTTMFSEEPKIGDADYIFKASSEIKKNFEKGISYTNLTEMQLEILYEYGADLVYSTINKNVKIMNTQPIGNGLQRSIARTKNLRLRDRIILDMRERYTARRVREYLDANPGETVALVYGAFHNFNFDFKRDLPLQGWWIFRQPGERNMDNVPVLTEIFFPQAMNLILLSLHYDNIFSFHFLKSALSTLTGFAKLSQERKRYKQRQAKRKLRGQIKTVENVDRLEEQEKFFKKLGW